MYTTDLYAISDDIAAMLADLAARGSLNAISDRHGDLDRDRIR